MKLYFFPAILPLAELFPLLLSLVALLAGAFQVFKKRILISLGLLLLGAILFFYPKQKTPSSQQVETLPKQIGLNWIQYTPRKTLSGIGYYDQTLAVGTVENTLDIFGLDGALKYSWKLAAPVLATPLVVQDSIYAGEGLHTTSAASLYAFSREDGKFLWSQKFKGHLESTPASDGEFLFGCAGEAGIYKVDRFSGKKIWELGYGHCDTTPALDAESLFASFGKDSNTLLLKLNKATGEKTLETLLKGSPWGNVLIVGDFLYLLTGIGQFGPKIDANEKSWLYKINKNTGAIVWEQAIVGLALLDLQWKDHLLIITKKQGAIEARSLDDGKIAWIKEFKSPILANSRILDDKVLVYSYEGDLSILEIQTGKLLQTLHVGQESNSPPLILKDQLFLASKAQLQSLAITLLHENKN